MGEHSPLLSFVMPAWKGAWLAEAIESILAQKRVFLLRHTKILSLLL